MEMEDSSPSSLAAPHRSPQAHDISLASFPTNPTHSYQHSQSGREHHNVLDPSQLVTNTIESTHEYTSSTYPSLSQQDALAVLQFFDNQVVLAWLTGLRSFRADGNDWFQPGSLSSQQFEAISALKCCPDGLLSSWLDFTRSGGAFDGLQNLHGNKHPGTQRASANLLHNSWQGSSNTSRSSVGSFGALPSLYDGNTVPTTPTSSRSRGTFLDLSREPSIDEATQLSTVSHSHWCFICENPRVITTCDGWKRHMKEHETRYRCMPRGPIEYTADGARCAFCGFRNPNRSHCDTHKAFPCANKSFDVRSYTRKSHFINHLKTHHIPDCAELADHWRDSINKRHFSCGFCVSHFHSLLEQLNHIDTAHYRLFQHVRDWNSNNVIRGLLLQPGVYESWRRRLASRPGLTDSLLGWDWSVIKRLQFRLEMSNEPADTLAEVAFNESTYGWSHHGEAETIDAAGLSHNGGLVAPRRSSVTQATAPLYLKSSEGSTADEDMLTSSASHMEPPGWPWAVPNNSLSHEDQVLSQGDSDVSERNAMMELQYPYRNTGQRLTMSSTNYRTQPQPSPYAPWTASKILDSSLTTPSSVMAGDCWQATPILNPTNSSSLVSDQPRYQSPHSMGKARAMFATQISSPASRHKVSPMIQTPSPSAKPSLASQPRKQPSRSKLKDHYDINTEADMDLDLDILQRLMHDEESTRSERRSR